MSYPGGNMTAMTNLDPLTRFDRATAATRAVIAAVRPDQLNAPSPCTQWTVREVINHLVSGQEFFAHSIDTGTFDRDLFNRDRDFLGPDPAAAFATSAARLRTRFAADGLLERTMPTPFGPRPGAVLVEMRITEALIHGWDVARATGQSTDLVPDIIEPTTEGFRRMRSSAPPGGPFGPEQPAPSDATAADRLAALAGRHLA
jgi:uncharacterized protein (TIGR03086 family)